MRRAARQILGGCIISQRFQVRNGTVREARHTERTVANLEKGDPTELIMPSRLVCALLWAHPLVDIMVQLLQRRSDDTTPARRACGDRHFPGGQILRDAARNGRLGPLSWPDKVDRGRREAEGVDLAWRREIIHLVVEDDAVRGHDLGSPIQIDCGREGDSHPFLVDRRHMTCSMVIQRRVVGGVVVRYGECHVVQNFAAHIRNSGIRQIILLQFRDIGRECGVAVLRALSIRELSRLDKPMRCHVNLRIRFAVIPRISLEYFERGENDSSAGRRDRREDAAIAVRC